jgi:hypothetical protein
MSRRDTYIGAWIMKKSIIFSVLAAMVICVTPVLAEDSAPPTPFTFLKAPTPPPEQPSLADRTTIELRRDGDKLKDKKTGEEYKVTDAGTTMTIKNLQTGEKIDYRVSGETLTNKDTGQKFKIRRDGSNITITKKD